MNPNAKDSQTDRLNTGPVTGGHSQMHGTGPNVKPAEVLSQQVH